MLSCCFFVEYMIKQTFSRIIFRFFSRNVNAFSPFLCFLCFTLIIPVWLFGDTVFAQELPWPIKSPKRISSSFGEPRPGRFHFGVDFKSGGVTGKKVVAIGNGYISRVRTSPFGYGKGLYLTLDSGKTAVYGHLSGYIPEIEDIIRKLWGRIKDGKNRSYIFKLREAEGDLAISLQDLKDRMTGGEAKGAVQAVIDSL